MDQRSFEDPEAANRRGSWIGIALLGAIAIIALILAALAFGRAAPAVARWSPLPLNFSGRCSMIVNASGQTNGNEAKIYIPIVSCVGTGNSSSVGPLSAPLPARFIPAPIVSTVDGVVTTVDIVRTDCACTAFVNTYLSHFR